MQHFWQTSFCSRIISTVYTKETHWFCDKVGVRTIYKMSVLRDEKNTTRGVNGIFFHWCDEDLPLMSSCRSITLESRYHYTVTDIKIHLLSSLFPWKINELQLPLHLGH